MSNHEWLEVLLHHPRGVWTAKIMMDDMESKLSELAKARDISLKFKRVRIDGESSSLQIRPRGPSDGFSAFVAELKTAHLEAGEPWVETD